MSLKPRREVFDTYWKFAAERQNIFFKRVKGESAPWTNDPILSEHKFCNAYRASDRVSQYLIKYVIYDGVARSDENTIFRILLFKIFNKIETWQYLEERLDDVNLSNFSPDLYGLMLEEATFPIYTAAYMSCASKVFGYDRKHMNHLCLIEKMMQENLPQKVTQCQNMEELYKLLLSYPMIGKFMAYQLATDINYSEVVNFSEMAFTVAGPGAVRGIAKCFEDTGGLSDAEIIKYMAENQEKEFKRLGLNFQSLWGRPLQLIDCQNLFCETDKYCRKAFPNMKSNRSQIKQKFTQTPKQIEFFYPPKWKLKI